MKQPPKKPVKGTKNQFVPEDITADDIPSHPPEIDDEELVDDEPLDDTPTDVELPAEKPSNVPNRPGPNRPQPPAPPAAPPKPPGEPIDKEKVIGFIESIISTLTFKTVALVALLVGVGLIIFGLYENRGDIVTKITTPNTPVVEQPTQILAPDWVLSESSKQSLVNLAKATNVGMVILADVDLKKNRRTVRYYYLEDPAIVLEPAATQALALPLPVFDYDAKNTEQMVAILSNDFRCDKWADTVYNRFAPELGEKFPTVCRLAVPPFVGMFVGFITVGISGDPRESDLETIRLEVSRIAVEIYMNDATKKTAAKK